MAPQVSGRGLAIAAIVTAWVACGCATYFDDDSVSVRDLGNRYHISIGYKRFVAFGQDPELASTEVTKQVVAEKSICPNGYTRQVDPNIRTGSYGFSWYVDCKSAI